MTNSIFVRGSHISALGEAGSRSSRSGLQLTVDLSLVIRSASKFGPPEPRCSVRARRLKRGSGAEKVEELVLAKKGL